MLAILITINLVSLSSNDERINPAVNTYQIDNLDLVATMAVMSDTRATNSRESNTQKIESPTSHCIETSSQKNQSSNITDDSVKLQGCTKRKPQALCKLLSPFGVIKKV